MAPGYPTVLGMYLFTVGTKMTMRAAPRMLVRGLGLLSAKVGTATLFALAVAHLFGGNLLGLSTLAVMVAMSDTNGGMFLALTGVMGDKDDTGTYVVQSIETGPFLTMLIFVGTGLAVIPWLTMVSVIAPIVVGAILGNLDDELKEFFGSHEAIIVPFMAFTLGQTINLKSVVTAGLPGVALGLTVVIVTGVVCIMVDRLLGGSGVAGAAASSTAGNSAAVPQAVALADPSFAAVAPAATVQVAASVIVTAILTPLLTAWWSRRSPLRERIIWLRWRRHPPRRERRQSMGRLLEIAGLVLVSAWAGAPAARAQAPSARQLSITRRGHRLWRDVLCGAVRDLPRRAGRRHRRREPASGQFRNAIDRSRPRPLHHRRLAGRHAGVQVRHRRNRGHHRLPAQHECFDLGTVKPGDAARGRSIFEGKGACPSCHRVAGPGRTWRPNLSDIGAVRSAGSLERSLARPDQPDDADQPPGARRDEGRHGHQRPAAQRGHLQGAAHGRPGAPLSLIKADLREYTIATTSPMPSYKDKLVDARSPTWWPTCFP